jgi:hypothetical protein
MEVMPTHLTQIAADDHMEKVREDARRWRALLETRDEILGRPGPARRARIALRRRLAAEGRPAGAPGTAG